MHLSSFYVDAKEGELPPSLATHPQKQPQPQEQSLVVYTEDLTQPDLLHPTEQSATGSDVLPSLKRVFLLQF